MPAHVITTPPTIPTTNGAPAIDPGWSTLSMALTDEAPLLADRDDLIVRIAPGAGHGAPACFLPATAVIEVDGTHLGHVDPATATPHLSTDRARYGTAWGLLVHECAHARHSLWEAPAGTPSAVRAAAELLEESRIERAQIRRRPGDRHWLRASASKLILADSRALDPARASAMTDRDAAHTAALTLARADAGILRRTEVAPVERVVLATLGAAKLSALQAVWTDAHTTDDTDAEAMVALGRRWCDILGIDHAAPSGPADPGIPDPSVPGTPAPSSVSGPLAQAVRDTVMRVNEAVATDNASRTAPPRGTSPTPGGTDGGPSTSTTRTRPATGAERRAARQVGAALTTAGVRERTATRTTSALPPGRLRMRGALAADAQRAAGAVPTAEPFTRTTRTVVPTPPLRVGIACDVSKSMTRFTGPVASAAWILAHAVRHARVPMTTATVTFGATVRSIACPGVVPDAVTVFDATSTSHAVDDAIADTPTIAAMLASAGFAPTLPTGGTYCEWARPSTRLRAAYPQCEWGNELVLELIGEHEQPDWTVRIENDVPAELAADIVEAVARAAAGLTTLCSVIAGLLPCPEPAGGGAARPVADVAVERQRGVRGGRVIDAVVGEPAHGAQIAAQVAQGGDDGDRHALAVAQRALVEQVEQPTVARFGHEHVPLPAGVGIANGDEVCGVGAVAALGIVGHTDLAR